MNVEIHKRAKAIFLEAANLNCPQRDTFLDESCGDDTALREEVESLLRFDQNGDANDSLDESSLGINRKLLCEIASEVAADNSSNDDLPEMVGAYRVIRKIAEGGMGIVFEGEQQHPKRRVALKLIRSGIVTQRLRQRFHYEAEVLGRLQHPGIAHIIEAGTFDADHGSQPFFAMEYIDGQSLHNFARSNDLSPRQRLTLFTRVCHAVHYAHQCGVIHRDLKPSNILVDATGQPKILDFGVARLTDSDMQATTQRTDLRQLVGTIPYMSPEQVAGDIRRLDTRSDVYSLGVICYELITGQLPYDLRNRSIPEAIRIIGQEEPSTLSSINRRFRGDLNTIVAKAIDRDPQRRYQSTSELAADIDRYLRGEPIDAKRDSTIYVLRKNLSRYRVALSVAALFFVTVTLSMIALGLMYSRQTALLKVTQESETLASDEASKANAVIATLQEILSPPSPESIHGPQYTLLQLLEDFEPRLAGSFRGQPEVEATVRTTVGKTYRTLGMYANADPHLEEALRLRREAFGETHDAIAESLDVLGQLKHDLGELDEAETLIQLSLAMRQKLHGERHPLVAQSMNNLAEVYLSMGRFREAEFNGDAALQIREDAFGRNDLSVADSLSTLSKVAQWNRRYEDAEAMMREVLRITESQWGARHRNIAIAKTHLASYLIFMDRYEEAKVLYEQALKLQEETLGPDHPSVATTLNRYGELLSTQHHDHEEARAIFDRAIQIYRDAFGRQHHLLAICIRNAGINEHQARNFTKAVDLYREALAMTRAVLGEDHQDVIFGLMHLANGLRASELEDEASAVREEIHAYAQRLARNKDARAGRQLEQIAEYFIVERQFDLALQFAHQALDVQRAILGSEHAQVAVSLNQLGYIYFALEDFHASETYLREALDLRVRMLGKTAWETIRTTQNLANTLIQLDRFDDALALIEDAFNALAAENGLLHPPTRGMGAWLANLYKGLAQYEVAIAIRQEFLNAYLKPHGLESSETAYAMVVIGNLQVYARQFEDAIESLSKALDCYEAIDHPLDYGIAVARYGLSRALARVGRIEEATAIAKQSVEDFEQLFRPGHFPAARLSLAHSLALMGDFEDADAQLSIVATDLEKAQDSPNRLDTQTLMYHIARGQCRTAEKRFEEAEQILLECPELAQQVRSMPGHEVHEAIWALIDLYTAWEKPQQAAEWHEQLAKEIP